MTNHPTFTFRPVSAVAMSFLTEYPPAHPPRRIAVCSATVASDAVEIVFHRRRRLAP